MNSIADLRATHSILLEELLTRPADPNVLRRLAELHVAYGELQIARRYLDMIPPDAKAVDGSLGLEEIVSGGLRERNSSAHMTLRRPRNQDELRRIAITAVLARGDVLEVGSGSADLAVSMAMCGNRVFAIDCDPLAVDIGRDKVAELGVEDCYFRVADGAHLSFPDGSFDTVVLAEVLEYVNSPERVLEEALRVLCNGGKLILSVPNGHEIPNPEHKRTFTRDDVEALLHAHGIIHRVDWISTVPPQWILVMAEVTKEDPAEPPMDPSGWFLRPFPVGEIASRPLVSVIIPTYNRAQWLGESIQSILNQRYDNIQLIVVDDGSTDNTEEVVRAFGERVTYLRKENGGKSSAVNLGLRYALGKYISIFDDDDIALPQKLSSQVRFLEQHPDVGLVYSAAAYFVNTDRQHIVQWFPAQAIPREKMLVTEMNGNIFHTPTVVFRRECFERVGPFDERLIRAQDYDYWLRILAAGFAAAPLNVLSVLYRVHDKIRGSSEQLIEARDVVSKTLEYEKIIFSKLYHDLNLKQIFPWRDLSVPRELVLSLIERAILMSKRALFSEVLQDMTEVAELCKAHQVMISAEMARDLKVLVEYMKSWRNPGARSIILDLIGEIADSSGALVPHTQVENEGIDGTHLRDIGQAFHSKEGVQMRHPLPSTADIVDRRAFTIEFCRGKRVLHLGCVDSGLIAQRLATGMHLHQQLANAAKKLWGVDIDEEGVELLRSRGFNNIFVHNVEDMDSLVLDDDQPDVIVATEIIEHLSNPGRFLSSVRSRFPEAELLISVPNAYAWSGIRSMLSGEETVHEDHNYYFSYTTLVTLLRKHGYMPKYIAVYSWDYRDPEFDSELKTVLQRNPFFAEGLIVVATPKDANSRQSSVKGTLCQASYNRSAQNGGALQSGLHTTQKVIALAPPKSSGKNYLTFWAGDMDNFHFVEHIVEHLSRRYNVRTIRAQGLTQDNMRLLLSNSALAWFEWANGPIEAATMLPKVCPILCRIHKYEIFSPHPKRIDWSRVDCSIFVSGAMQKAFAELHPGESAKMNLQMVIPNAVDLNKFKFANPKRGYSLACVARVHPDKNLPLLIQCMAALVKRDPRYRCYIAGRVQDIALYNYLREMISNLGLDDHIKFEGVINDMPGWLKDKSYIVSTSIVERHPVNLLEGMAVGLKPVVHSFHGGADALFPREFIFRTVDEFVEAIMSEDYSPAKYREFVEKRYSVAGQLKIIDQIVAGYVDYEPPGKECEVEASLQYVEGLIEDGMLIQALIILSRLRGIFPQNAPILNDLGVVESLLGDIQAAYQLFALALSLDPKNEDIARNASWAAEQLGCTGEFVSLAARLGINIRLN